jgi:hypothetical protein
VLVIAEITIFPVTTIFTGKNEKWKMSLSCQKIKKCIWKNVKINPFLIPEKQTNNKTLL